MSPLIKVCGMTEAENIRNVELQGVDMIGFIFYPKSPRCLCQMPGYLPACAKRVGVFVNESKENILMYTDRFGLDYIQLHGHEAPEYCRSLRNAGLHLIKAFSILLPKDLLAVSAYNGLCDYYLFDTKTPQYGGVWRPSNRAFPATSSTGTSCTATTVPPRSCLAVASTPTA